MANVQYRIKLLFDPELDMEKEPTRKPDKAIIFKNYFKVPFFYPGMIVKNIGANGSQFTIRDIWYDAEAKLYTLWLGTFVCDKPVSEEVSENFLGWTVESVGLALEEDFEQIASMLVAEKFDKDEELKHTTCALGSDCPICGIDRDAVPRNVPSCTPQVNVTCNVNFFRGDRENDDD